MASKHICRCCLQHGLRSSSGPSIATRAFTTSAVKQPVPARRIHQASRQNAPAIESHRSANANAPPPPSPPSYSSKRDAAAAEEQSRRTLLQPNNLFHPFSQSPAAEIRKRAATMRHNAYCPHPDHQPTSQSPAASGSMTPAPCTDQHRWR